MKPIPVSLAAVALVLIAGCTSPSDAALDALDELPEPPTTTTTTTTGPQSTTTTTTGAWACSDETVTQSFDPNGPLPPPGELRPDGILGHGSVRVGVDEHTLGFASRDPRTGDYEGFEVALATEIVERIFGSEADVDFVPLVTKEKTTELGEDGLVDMTVSAVTMSCSRWAEVAFSTEYYTAVQKFLVRQDAGIAELADLAGNTVCVTEGSSSARIMRNPTHVDPSLEIELLEVPSRPDCLVALQTNRADAYFGHDSFLYGMLIEDPTMEIRDLRMPLAATESNYGIAISRDNVEFVRLVNAALEQIRADGTWNELVVEHLETLVPPDLMPTRPPDPEYRAE